jgi:DNA-binding CsgD family transcriptional regulator
MKPRLRPSQQAVLLLIERFYEAAMEPSLWLGALESLGDMLGGAAFVLSAIDSNTGLKFVATSRLDSQYQMVLAQQFGSAATNPLVAAMPRVPAGRVVARSSLYSDTDYFRGDLYNSVFRPQELTHRAVACLHRTPDLVIPFGILRQGTKTEFETPQIALLDMLLPHLRRAILIAIRFGTLETALAATREGMNHISCGVVLADAHSKVTYVNQAAEDMIAAGDGLTLRRGVLGAQRHCDDVAISAAIDQAVQGAGISIHTACRRNNGGSYILLVIPSSRGASSLTNTGERGVTVLISDLERKPKHLEAGLIDLFGASKREAQMAAALLRGQCLEDLAEEWGTSINTLRTQLKSLLGKTNTRRQVDLIQLLASIPDTYPRA